MESDLNFLSLGIALLAGLLSTLSPCVLPLIPLVVAPAASAHRFGVLALTGGLILSFVLVGLFVTTIGLAIGLDGETFRKLSAVLLGLLGIVLLSERLQQFFSQAGSG
ncbi:MAG: sulfite exporter TauE/SafE family protein, partial [Cyanobacteria bacterium]|nr:sulfite exporter TauE/SafE family protein [Cyanobacteriota bacterium]